MFNLSDSVLSLKTSLVLVSESEGESAISQSESDVCRFTKKNIVSYIKSMLLKQKY